MKCLTIVCLGALLTLSAAPDAFAWGAVTGPRGGAAARGPYGGTAYRPPAYGGGTVYRNTTVVAPGYGYGAAAAGVAVGAAAGAAVGAAAASSYPSCYYPPYYCYPPPYYQAPAW